MAQYNRKCTSEQRLEVQEAYGRYIDETDFPIGAEFISRDPVAIKYGVKKDDLYDWPELRKLLDQATAKYESYLVRKGMNGQSTAMSIFLLKQPTVGYRDRVEQDLTSNGEKMQFSNILPRPAKKAETRTDRVKKKAAL